MLPDYGKGSVSRSRVALSRHRDRGPYRLPALRGRPVGVLVEPFAADLRWLRLAGIRRSTDPATDGLLAHGRAVDSSGCRHVFLHPRCACSLRGIGRILNRNPLLGGMQVGLAVESFLIYLANLSDGAALVLAYWSPLRKRFTDNAAEITANT